MRNRLLLWKTSEVCCSSTLLSSTMIKKTTKPRALNRSTELRKADEAFSLFIRTRDSQAYQGRAFRCISCGKIKPIEQGDCGHFCNRGHMATRFSELNSNCQCRLCNRFMEGNIQGYRQGLIKKIGEKSVILLEAERFSTHKMDAFDLHEIYLYYKKKVKEFEYQIK